MYCSYCILQVYYDHPHQVLFGNFEDLTAEVRHTLSRISGAVRIGTGEFADSLFLDEQTGMSVKIAALLAPFPNVVVEFKTKSVTIGHLGAIADPSKVVIGFSMNTPRIIAECEQGTASLDARCEAIRRCEEMGFWIGIHFDPMVWYDRWRVDYETVVERIFSCISNPERIAWWSLGGFRTMPALKSRLRALGRHLPLFAGEMVPGADKKLRYFRQVRTGFYTAMREKIERFYPECTLYLCMESREVWEEAGLLSRIPAGLTGFLDTRAEQMLAAGRGMK